MTPLEIILLGGLLAVGAFVLILGLTALLRRDPLPTVEDWDKLQGEIDRQEARSAGLFQNPAPNPRSPYECYWSRRALEAERQLAKLQNQKPQ